MTTPTTAAGTTRTSPGSDSADPAGTDLPAGTLDQFVSVLTAPVALAQRVLPNSPLPVALGAGALLLAGVVEWPVAGALGLGYLALRGWRTRQ
jgi:hypothetical protein